MCLPVYLFIKIHKALKKIHFINKAGADIFFNDKGDMYLGFNLQNWIEYPNETLYSAIVGHFDDRNSSQTLTIDESLIQWDPSFNNVSLDIF